MAAIGAGWVNGAWAESGWVTGSWTDDPTPDVTLPVITLLGGTPINVTLGDPYTDAGATALDNIDGDITANIIVAGDTVNSNVLGTYIVTYNVQDAAGNAAIEVTRTVVVALTGTSGVIYPIACNFDKIAVGDVGTVIKLSLTESNSVIDISTATVKNIVIVSPDGAKLTVDGVFDTDGTDGILNYVTLTNDIKIPGEHAIQAFVTTSSWSGYSNISKFTVIQNL